MLRVHGIIGYGKCNRRWVCTALHENCCDEHCASLAYSRGAKSFRKRSAGMATINDFYSALNVFGLFIIGRADFHALTHSEKPVGTG